MGDVVFEKGKGRSSTINKMIYAEAAVKREL